MNKSECDAPGCGKAVATHFVRAERRKAVAERHLCEEHGRTFLYEYHRSANAEGVGGPLRQGQEEGASFDPEMLVFDDVGDQRGPLCQVFLVEAGGTRRVGITVGPWEGQALRLELQQYKAPRPLTHRAMAAVIAGLGGHLRYVVIDKFFPAQEVAYEAKLNIQQLNAPVVVDVRPSDALVLAVICDAPIIVSEGVLASMAQMQRG